jgi:hypothetical protein
MEKHYGVSRGTVVDNVDPEGMGRVTVSIAGKIDESEWALPYGVGGGSRGSWNIPPIGALVWVSFEDGNLDSPIWAHGPWTKPAADALIPEDATEAQADDPETAHLLKTIETSFFKITCDERPSPDDNPMNRKEFLRLVHKESGDMLEIDAVARGIYVKSTASIVLKTLGMIKLDATLVQIGDRLVQPGTHVI